MASPSEATGDMFRPPINRAMRVLDRAFFKKEVPLSAARIANTQNILFCRTELEKDRDTLTLDRLPNVRPDPELGAQGKKCILLRPEIKHDDTSTWSTKIHDLVRTQHLSVIPYMLKLEYDYWTYHDIMSSILPESEQDELPKSFSTVGHVAHLNLRDQYLPYKTLIATVLLDKVGNARTVINKIDNVGKESEYRTFQFEILAGEPDLNVEVSQSECTFRFDFSRVYWNSRLNTEHQRVVDMFEPGEAVCDVMAGVGPFSIPAGKKGVIVWANDLNPHGYASLQDGIHRNRVKPFVRAFNTDARAFIPTAIRDLLHSSRTQAFIKLPAKRAPASVRNSDSNEIDSPARKRHPMIQPPPVPIPPVFSHFVMNLPASATTFLPAFIGSHAGMEEYFHPHTPRKLPMVHVYCFTAISADPEVEKKAVCKEVSRQLEYEISGDEEDTLIWDVRDVAPNKTMLCVSFRLPPEVIFRIRNRSWD